MRLIAQLRFFSTATATTVWMLGRPSASSSTITPTHPPDDGFGGNVVDDAPSSANEGDNGLWPTALTALLTALFTLGSATTSSSQSNDDGAAPPLLALATVLATRTTQSPSSFAWPAGGEDAGTAHSATTSSEAVDRPDRPSDSPNRPSEPDAPDAHDAHDAPLDNSD